MAGWVRLKLHRLRGSRHLKGYKGRLPSVRYLTSPGLKGYGSAILPQPGGLAAGLITAAGAIRGSLNTQHQVFSRQIPEVWADFMPLTYLPTYYYYYYYYTKLASPSGWARNPFAGICFGGVFDS